MEYKTLAKRSEPPWALRSVCQMAIQYAATMRFQSHDLAARSGVELACTPAPRTALEGDLKVHGR